MSSIARINFSSHDHRNAKMPSQDSYENNIRKQITQLEDKVNNLANDEEKTKEEKTKEKKNAQEQIQNLNNELRQYQIQKKQEEAERKQEAIKQAMTDANPAEPEADLELKGFGGKESGVMISLSNTKEQLEGMVRMRTNLEGMQRTADTEEEKAVLQKKINNISKGIGQKLTVAKNTISDYHKTAKNEDAVNANQSVADLKKIDSQKGTEIFWVDTKQPLENTLKIANDKAKNDNSKVFDNVSVVIK